tara:strand:+ start:1895 stop:2083 length:189 start_codon:yes stop_codon:yes gene_type:complete
LAATNPKEKQMIRFARNTKAVPNETASIDKDEAAKKTPERPAKPAAGTKQPKTETDGNDQLL